MFTGIVTEVGTVEANTATDVGMRMVVDAPGTAGGLAIGASIAINGVCLTAVDVDGARVAVDVVAETIHRTSLGALSPGDHVNLERPLAADGVFDGHMVQGHVDGVGEITGLGDDLSARLMRVESPASLGKYLVEKGSVAVDGVSLTVTAASAPRSEPAWFEVSLIPHTLAVTALGERGEGDLVNLEVDVVAKYVERIMEDKE